MNYSKIIASQIVIMFIIMLVGVVCYKLKLINKQGSKQLSDLALNVVGPVLIFMSYQKPYDRDMAKGLLWSFLLSAISFAVMIVLSFITVSRNNPDKGLERFSSIYSNCAFIGIPLIDGVYGSEGVLYLTAYITFFNVLVWTHGLMTMKEEKDFSSLFKALRSPNIIAVALGLICYFTGLHIPEIPAKALNFIGAMNTPLAMIIAGATVAQTNLPEALKNKKNYIVSAYRLILFPAAAFLVCMLLHAPTEVLMTVTIASACPAAAIGTMFAVKMEKKPQRASEIFAMTTVLSSITLPCVTLLAMQCVSF